MPVQAAAMVRIEAGTQTPRYAATLVLRVGVGSEHRGMENA